MASFTMRGGGQFETVTPGEMRGFIAEQEQIAQARQREQLRGIKYIRLPTVIGTPTAGALTMGGTSAAAVVGPEMGDAWVIRHLWIKGLTTGTSPDLMNVLVNNQTWWQLNGNNFAYTFSKGEIILLQGESFTYQNSGILAATGQITVGGACWRIPGERLAELI